MLLTNTINVSFHCSILHREHSSSFITPIFVCPVHCILHSSIGQNIKSLAWGAPVSNVQSQCEKLQMAIIQQRVIRSTSCLVLCWVFSKVRLALFNLMAHELHELYYDRPTAYRGIGQTPCSFEHVSCCH